MRKANLINQIRGILNPDTRPEILVFRECVFNHDKTKSIYEFRGSQLTKAECLAIPAKRHCFIIHRTIQTTSYENQTNFNGTSTANVEPYKG